MNRIFTDFKIQQTGNQVVIYSLANHKLIEKRTFNIISLKEIQQLIEHSNTLELENYFLNNLDIKSIFKNKVGFSLVLKDCFLVYDEKFDLNSLKINKLIIEQSVLSSPVVDISKAEINKVSFAYSYFITKDFNFSEAIIKDKGINFRSVKFSDGTKNFEGTVFLGGDVNFSLAEFGNGNVIFQDAFFGKGRVNFSAAFFGEGKKDFVRAIFSEGEKIFERTNFGDGVVTFRSANFSDGSVNFRRSIFGKGELSFQGTTFGYGNIKFTSAEFSLKKISFRLTKFGDGIKDFHYSQFADTDLIFDRTEFSNGDIDFKACDFGTGRIIFNRISINSGSIIFEGIEKKEGLISFKSSYLGTGKFIFDYVKAAKTEFQADEINFGVGKISFLASHFETIFIKNSQINDFCDLRLNTCNRLIINDSVIRDVLDLSSSNFIPQIKYLDFSGTKLIGRIYLSWEDLDIKKLIYNQKTSLKQKAEQFAMLKENFRTNGQYNEEDFAYVEFKRLEAKAKLRKKIKENPKRKIIYYAEYLFKIIIMDKLGAYATKPVKVLINMLVIYIFFSFLYLFIEIIFPENGQILSSLFSEGDPRILSKIGKAFYHSAITFLTIGYGDYYPDGINRWLSAIEGFIGLFMMSYFTVAFVRKVLR